MVLKTRIKLCRIMEAYLVMLLPESITAAILAETEQGKSLQTELSNLKLALAAKDAAIEELKALVSEGAASQVALTAKISELEANAVDLVELERRISEINPSPVSDAVVAEVQINEDIDTPDDVDSVVVAPETVQPEAVVSSAIDAVNAYLSSEDE
jgi:hypothetical protein